MDSLNCTTHSTRRKLSQKLTKFINLKTTTKTLSIKKQETEYPNCTPTEAFIAKIFAAISVIKAAYAELQIAQIPYNLDSIKSADESVISELTALSDLNEGFTKNQVESSFPYMTLLLSEIQEQQSLIKMYEISINKLEHEIEAKKSEFNSIRKKLNRVVLKNKSMEKKLKTSTSFSILDGVKLSDSNTNNFIKMLNYGIRSVRSFVKLLISEMEYANWNIEVAAKSIQPEAVFDSENHMCFVFESFVCREMFDGFNDPNFGVVSNQYALSDEFNKLKSANSIKFLKQYRNSKFGEFVKRKYFRLVPDKMEGSFTGNLKHRKMVSVGEYPETEFFRAFAEMARRVWLLHCLAYSFGEYVKIFRVRNKCRFSQVFMEDVTGCCSAGNGFAVAFTVVPGFKVGGTVIQSQVYLVPKS